MYNILLVYFSHFFFYRNFTFFSFNENFYKTEYVQ